MEDRSPLPFAHLHCHSHYSLLDGASRIPELVAKVKELGMNAVALTDHGTLAGVIELYREAKAAGIKPIIGYEAYIAPGKRTERDSKGMSEAAYHLTLLAHSEQGFKNLVKMSSIAYTEGFYYRPRIDKELLAAHAEGITCLSGCLSSEFSGLLIKDQFKEAEKLAGWFGKTFSNHFYIEIQSNGLELQAQTSQKAIDLANKMGLPLVATCDAHYLCQADADAHDVLLCINTGRQRSDTNRMRYGSNQFYIRNSAEMRQLFPGQDEAIRRSQEIADHCVVEIDLKKRHFPVFTPPKKKSPEDYLRELCLEGLKERYGESPRKIVLDRLEHELKIINKLGFASYFLIVWDFVRFAHENGIPAGARGSACGALVSYVLKLSHVDPLEYDLLFERFLDPNRAEAPDIDIDFCQDRREEVIQYVKQKYGENSVAQIATYGTLAARNAIRDVGRVLGIDLNRVNQLANLIPKAPLGVTIEQSMEMVADLRQAYEKDPEVHELLDFARKIEGNNRNVGTHAAGVVIANGPITDYVPVQRVTAKASDGQRKEADGDNVAITTQWTMEDLEKVGMLKMDFLGLRTLTLLDHAVALIKQTKNIQIDPQKLPLDDAKTYELLSAGKTQGVFQFESEGIRNLLQRLKPDNIRDIIACTALYRPGPLQGGMVDDYINRKHGREQPTYQHELMEELLRETYGVMVYQEQVMLILNVLGGIELSSAYACIKAISKKKTEIINQRKDEFIKGAVKRGVEDKVAAEIFELIEFFGGYGFNKSHSTAYAYVSYQTAYLKAHYPAEFMAAVLTSEMGDTDKIAEYIRSSRENGITVLPPDLNASQAVFSVPDGGSVRYGLAALKGLGRKAADHIIAEREKNGPYEDLYDFCERVDSRVVTRAAAETLIKAGALDPMGDGNRAALMLALPGAIQAGTQKQEDRRHGQRSIFDMLEEEEPEKNGSPAKPSALPNVPRWSQLELLAFEKEAVGFYFSSHPLAEQANLLAAYSSQSLKDIERLPDKQEVMVGGMVLALRYTNAKRSRSGDTRMARFKFEDLTGVIDCVMFPDDFSRNKDMLKDELTCFVKATVDRSREQPGLIVNRLVPFEQAKNEATRGLVLKLTSQEQDEKFLARVAQILRRTPGKCPVFLDIADPGGRHARLRLGESYYIDATRVDAGALELLVGPGHLEWLGPKSVGV